MLNNINIKYEELTLKLRLLGRATGDRNLSSFMSQTERLRESKAESLTGIRIERQCDALAATCPHLNIQIRTERQ
jgi:hypothetical protein